MRFLRRRPPGLPARRARPSSADPVADAIQQVSDGPRLRRQFEDLEPVPADLPDYVTVVDCQEVDGFDTMVTLGDEIHAYVDPADSGLEQVLAEQPGIADVFAEDREVVFVRTRLALADVRAAVIRSVAEANLHPRRPVPAPEVVTDAQIDDLADAAAPTLIEAGFVRRAGDRRQGRYFARAGGDGFLQSAAILPGLGTLSDGTRLDRLAHVHVGVHVPEAAPPSAARPTGLVDLVPIHCTLSLEGHVEATAETVTRQLTERSVPWLAATRDRASLAAWVAADPERVWPPAARPLHARLFAEWGHSQTAVALLRHLDRKWRSMRQDPDAVAARAILGHRG